MKGCCDPGGYRGVFSEREARRNADRYRKGGLDRTARAIVGFLRRRGVSGMTVLEVGGGVGAIQLELLRSGATRATNVELSSEYEVAASDLAREAGFADAVERRIGDFVDLAADVPPADVVVMHRVVCCYPYLDALLAPAADHAREFLALTYPRATGLIRAAIGLGNLWFRLTRSTFRAFVHPPATIERVAGEHGLRRIFFQSGFLWQTVVFERSSRPAA